MANRKQPNKYIVTIRYNAYETSFELFDSLRDARQMTAKWREEYPHVYLARILSRGGVDEKA